MRLLIFILAQFIITPLQTSVEPAKTKATIAAEKKVIKLIKALPEFIEENKYSLKMYKVPLDIELDRGPIRERNNYQVSVYLPRPDINMRNRRFTFTVDAKTYAIWVDDFGFDKTMSLEEWRCVTKAKRRAYEKTHRRKS